MDTMATRAIQTGKKPPTAKATANRLTSDACLSRCPRAQKSVLVLFVLLNLSVLHLGAGCRLKVPNVSEQQKLMEKGAFPNGPPSWVASVALGGARGRHLPSMLAPGFSSSGSRQAVGGPITGSEEIQARLERQTPKQTEQKPQQKTDSNSPLSAIAQLCPEVERDTAKTLVIPDTQTQIDHYTILVKRCPNSPDLWTWLGEAYYRKGLVISAKKCFQQALFLDSSHPLSKKYLDQLTASP